MPIPEQNPITITTKPHLDQMSNYFNQRLSEDLGQIESYKLKQSIPQAFDNTYYVSTGRTETTYAGQYQSMLVASHDGRQLVLHNPGLLHQITEGTINATRLVNQGAESVVYKTDLQTANGIKPYLLKYMFPLYDLGFYTPGIVTMKLLQQAEVDQPISGLHYATPILATYDMYVAPFVENSVNLNNLIEAMTPTKNTDLPALLSILGKNHQFTPEMKLQITDMLTYDNPNRRIKKSNTFLKQINDSINVSSKSLRAWLSQQINSDTMLMKHNIRRADYGSTNLVIDMSSLYDLFRKFRKNPQFNANSDQFLQEFYSCCHLVEIGLGVKK